MSEGEKHLRVGAGFGNSEVRAVLLKELRALVTADAVRQLPNLSRFEKSQPPRLTTGLVKWQQAMAKLNGG
jgi:hypothetical protein